jgi:hypothetical protein
MSVGAIVSKIWLKRSPSTWNEYCCSVTTGLQGRVVVVLLILFFKLRVSLRILKVRQEFVVEGKDAKVG